MSLAGWLEIASGVLAFPAMSLKLVKLLRATPQEHHEAILEAISKEADQYEMSGRPTWPWN